LLHEVDELKNKLGISRAALFSNAFRIYKVYPEDFLNKNSENETDLMQEQLYRIETILNSISAQESIIKENLLNQINNEPDISKTPTYPEIRGQILGWLEKFQSLSTPTLAKLMGLEEGFMFTICSQLKRDKFITLNEQFEWKIK